MGKWGKVKIGDVCTLKSGNSLSENILCAKGIPYVKVAELNLTENIPHVTTSIRFVSNNFDTKQVIPEGSVIFPKRGGAIGTNKKRLTACPIVADLNIMAVIPHMQLLPSYLYFYFEKIDLGSLGNGSSVPQINNGDISPLLIPLPPLDEQKRIAKNLGLASEIVKGYKEQLDELDKLVQSVFYEMFGDPVTNEKGWEISYLSEVCEKITDGTHNSPENLDTGEYRYITAKNIKRNGILLSNITYVSKEVHDEIYARCNPEIGDVLYIKDGVTTGIAAVNTLDEPFSMLSSVALLKLKNTICNKYLCNLLNCAEMYRKIRESMGGAAITRLTLVKIKNIQLPIPPLSLQTRFATIVTEIEAQIAQVQQALTQAENLFNSLMQEYFE